MVFLEDILGKIERLRKIAAALIAARLLPARIARAAQRKRTPDSLATVIFSSGSTGVPKGVMLSHYNVLSNIEAMAQVFWINDRDVHRRRAAVLPLLRIHGDHLAAAGERVRRGRIIPIRLEAAKIGELVRETQGHVAAFDADVLCRLHAQVHARKNSRRCASCWWVRKSCASPIGDGVPRKIRPGTARRIRLHRDVAGGRGEWPEFRSGTRYADGQQARNGGPSAAGSRREDRGSGQHGTAGAERGRPAAGEGPEPDARLFGPAGADRGSACATAGTSPATSARSTTKASCASRTGCRASARSGARWCRT